MAWLPETLPEPPKVVWQIAMSGDGLAGIAATDELVIVADRDVTDTRDLFRCVSADTGETMWNVTYPAIGMLDYGNSPRATPLIAGDRVYLLGAFGHLHCVGLKTGEIHWQRDLLAEFGAEVPTWGFCSSPLIVDGRLIINPGAPDASLVAIDAITGEDVWATPGREAAYSSFIEATFQGVRQLIGYDATSLGGWDPITGKRLWEVVPQHGGDFNVPTPIAAGERLIVSTENNGTRLYQFKRDGTIDPVPLAQVNELAPDTSTPIVLSNRVYGCCQDLFCLDVQRDLKTLWKGEDRDFADYVSIVGAPGRVLITTTQGELLLVNAANSEYKVISRHQLVQDGSEVHSHPAIVNRRCYIRSTSTLMGVDLGERPSS